MRQGWQLFLVLIAVVLALSSQTSHRSDADTGPIVTKDVFESLTAQGNVRVIVTLREPPALAGNPPEVAALRSQVANAQSKLLDALTPRSFVPEHRYASVPAIAGSVSKSGLAALRERPDVATVMLDGEGFAATSQSVPLIRADVVHEAGITGAGSVVAVLDTGVDTDHPDLENDIAYEKCYLGGGGCPPSPHVAEDDNGHGSNVAGIITDDGVVVPPGVAPDAKIAAYKVLGSSGGGLISDWILALDDIISNHPEVTAINMSLQSGISCVANSALEIAISTLKSLGVATFVAAGNYGNKNLLTLPGCVADAISVGATYDAAIGLVNGWKTSCSDQTTSADMVACWSSSDDGLDLLAPGAAILSAGNSGGSSTFFGTSQATPHAAGVAALLHETRPDLTVDELVSRMKATGKLVTDTFDDADPQTNRTTPRVDARVALLAPATDLDGDGCGDEEELGPDPAVGGGRNPLNPYDFYDMNGDGTVNLLDDVYAVVASFGPAAAPNYEQAADRSPPPPGATALDLGPPDGVVNAVDDVLGIVTQFGHRCAGPQ